MYFLKTPSPEGAGCKTRLGSRICHLNVLTPLHVWLHAWLVLQSTDELIQQTIRTRFRDCTVITIAHRIKTVMDSDRIFVLDAGVLIESGPPAALIEAKGAFFNLQKRST